MKLMKEKIFILSKRFFGVPSFYNYAIADGIYEQLKYTRTGIDNIKTKIGINLDSFQLSLFPELEPIWKNGESPVNITKYKSSTIKQNGSEP